MKSKPFEYGPDGRVVITDADLAQMEAHFVVQTAAGHTNGTCDTVNTGSCTNTTDCRGSTNSDFCTNSRACMTDSQIPQ